MAYPKADIDEAKLKTLMRLKPSLEDTAAFFECSGRTIERYIKAKFNLTFFEFRDQRMVHTRLNIVRKAIEKAEKGDNVMLIFCLKNLCGWTDKQPSEVPQVMQLQSVKLSDEQLEKLVKTARGDK